MDYPNDGRCKNCGADLPQVLHGKCFCEYCGTEYIKPVGGVNAESNTGKAMELCEKADIAYAKRSIGEAIGYLDEALRYDPENYMLWTKLGRVYRLANNSDRARECYQKAMSIKPGAVEVIANLGALEMTCNNHQLAYQYCKQAFEIGAKTPYDNAVYAANFALAAAKTGNKREAMRLLDVAKKRGYANCAAIKKMIKQC